MANVDRPCGFYPYGPILRVRPYIAKVETFRGDMVNRKAGSSDTNGGDEVEPGDASEAQIGVALNHAAVGGTVLVADHPDQEFIGQADGNDVATNAKIGLNYDLLATDGSGDQSAHEIDSSTFATSATLPIRVLRMLPVVDNALGANVKLICKINNHQLSAGTGSAGV
jgi:hypothetical protein